MGGGSEAALEHDDENRGRTALSPPSPGQQWEFGYKSGVSDHYRMQLP